MYAQLQYTREYMLESLGIKLWITTYILFLFRNLVDILILI